jgi:RNA polymerase primary sigma factor
MKNTTEQNNDTDSNDSQQIEPAMELNDRELLDIEYNEKEAKIYLSKGGDPLLDKYFKDLPKMKLLDYQGEIKIAKEFETAEVCYWQALLSYPPAFETVCTSLGTLQCHEEVETMLSLTKVKKHTKSHKEKWELLSCSLANKLRALDTDRVLVKEAYRLVKLLPISTEKYLTIVNKAYKAQQEVKNRFVTSNLKLVIFIASKYNRNKLALSDLIQEGNIGLFKAVEKFDYTRGYRFNTYAYWWIKNSINLALSTKGRMVRIPAGQIHMNIRVHNIVNAIVARTGEIPQDTEIEEKAQLTSSQLVKLREGGSRYSVSLDSTPITDGLCFMDLIEDERCHSPYEDLEHKLTKVVAQDLLKVLTPRESDIIRANFGLDGIEEKTLADIGKEKNLSRERIRQLYELALDKMMLQVATTREHCYLEQTL